MEYFLLFILIIVILVLPKKSTKQCIKCNNYMYSYGQVGDGAGADIDYHLYKCLRCGHTVEDLAKDQ